MQVFPMSFGVGMQVFPTSFRDEMQVFPCKSVMKCKFFRVKV